VFDAIVVDDRDNVATAITDLQPGRVTTNQGEYRLLVPLRAGHKFVIRDLQTGDLVVKYGSPIGAATTGIATGAYVHVHNVGDILHADGTAASERAHPVVPDHPDDPRKASWDVAALRKMTFNGYVRSDGRVGVRNHVLVVSTVGCANAAAERIAAQVDVPAITHQQGCLQLGDDLKLTRKQLNHVAGSPNVGAVLFVGLGCEANQAVQLMAGLGDKPVEAITIQGEGGTRKAVERGVQIVDQMKRELARQQRVPVGIDKLAVGTKCGGSDAFSGLTANPATGVASDMLVDAGGAVLLSETPGLYGSEPHLAARMPNRADRESLARALDRMWEESARLGELMSEGEMSPGNVEGGLTTLVEKSLGATTKAGTREFKGFLEFADRVPGPGLWLMDTPGYDIITISGQAAGGAQILLFTTGRGSPVGNAVAPVIKICSNSKTYSWMDEDMDVDAGSVISAGRSIEDVGREIFDLVIATANGMLTKAEEGGHREFALARIGSTL
jgi:altronate dehydratase